MVWIDNYAIPRQYFPTVVEARRKAILWLESSPGKTEQVFFYAARSSPNYNAYVLKETVKGEVYYSWNHYSKAYGMVSEPLYKNGKIDKRGC